MALPNAARDAGEGLICPHCRAEPPSETDESAGAGLPPPSDADGDAGSPTSISMPSLGGIKRCPNDGYAFVSAQELRLADGDPFLGATIADRYAIIGRLGAGSMGTVYRARHIAMARDVALKILRSDRAFDAHAKARFVREAKAMSLLASPHTVTVFDFGETRTPGADELEGADSLYLAMELLEGESVGARLKRVGRLSESAAVAVVRGALISLMEAHEKGVIHRDLKPDNLFLTRIDEGEVCKVLDFGIAKVVRDYDGALDDLETQAGTVFGTPRYMSPEQAQGKPLDGKSDLYSLGVIFYQMVTGVAPFTDDDAVVVMAHHIKTKPNPPRLAAPDASIGGDIEALILKSLEKNASKRPASAKAFLAALDAACVAQGLELGSASTTTGSLVALSALSTASAPRSGLPRWARGRAAVGFTGLALLAGVGAAVWSQGAPDAVQAGKGIASAAAIRAGSVWLGARQTAADGVVEVDEPKPEADLGTAGTSEGEADGEDEPATPHRPKYVRFD